MEKNPLFSNLREVREDQGRWNKAWGRREGGKREMNGCNVRAPTVIPRDWFNVSVKALTGFPMDLRCQTSAHK